MNKQQIGEEIEFEDGVLTYFITKTDIFCEGKKYDTYGIEVVKKSLSGIEKSNIEDVTISQERIVEIIDVVKRNKVAPIHLHDIMENFL